MRAAHAPGRRAGFTLIELLVVITIMLVVAALAAGFFVFSQDHSTAVTGSDRMSGWLLNSKQRAKRDQRPTGLRLLLPNPPADPKNPGNPTNFFVAQLAYIQEPDDYGVGLCNGTGGAPANQVTFGPAFPGGPAPDFQGGAAYPGEIDASTVQAGDYVEFFGGGGVHQITSVPNPSTLQLATNVTLVAVSNYRVIRQPRRLASEDLLDLPAGAIIDLTISKGVPQRLLVDANNPNGVPVAEILFSPGGAVAGQGTGGDKIVLYMHDPNKPADAGSPLLVSIQARTGFIGVNQVAPWNPAQPIGGVNNPYFYTQDGRSSGL
jgi:prepilin-type N-terminal cleavage/methylation domain-containing protein